MGFGEAQDGNRKKLVIAGVLIAIAIVVFISTNTGDSVGGGKADVELKCFACDHVEGVSVEKLQEMGAERVEWFLDIVAEEDPEEADSMRATLERGLPFGAISGGMAPWGAPSAPFTCPSCGENALCSAIRCPKCDTVFISYDDNDRRNDKCTNIECGYSRSGR